MIDLRITIGFFFLAVGGVLTAYGVISPHDARNLSEHINVDFDWGIVLLVFGGIMSLYGWLAECRAARERRQGGHV